MEIELINIILAFFWADVNEPFGILITLTFMKYTYWDDLKWLNTHIEF